jgi:hypothetical protein
LPRDFPLPIIDIEEENPKRCIPKINKTRKQPKKQEKTNNINNKTLIPRLRKHGQFSLRRRFQLTRCKQTKNKQMPKN